MTREAEAERQGGMTAIGTDSQVRLNFEHSVRGFAAYANDPAVLLDEIGDLSLHFQVKRRVELRVLSNKVHKIPLRHEG